MDGPFAYGDPWDRIPAATIRSAAHARLDTDVLSEILARLFTERVRVADVGAGRGRMLGTLAEVSNELVVVEPDASRLAVAKRQAPLLEANHVTWFCGGAAGLLATNPKGFDLILLSHVLAHMSRPDRRRSLAAVSALLAPGGTLILSTPVAPGRSSRYLVSEMVVAEGAVVTRSINPRRFDAFAEGGASREAHLGFLPVWQASESALARNMSGAGMIATMTVPYRQFSFELETPAGPELLEATDTIVVANRQVNK